MSKLNILTAISFILVLSSFSQPIMAQYSHTVLLDVGEEFSYDLPYDIKSKNMSTWYWTCNLPSNVEIVRQSSESVTVKPIKYTFSTVLVQFDCNYNILSGGRWIYGGRITFDLNVNIRNPDSDPGPDPTPDPNPTKFTYTYNGVSMLYKTISSSPKACMVGGGSADDKDKAVGKAYSTNSLTIPETANGYKVVEIATGAFLGCKNIKGFILPESIKRIGTNSFQDCDGISKIIVPNSVEQIDECAFSQCDNLTEVTIGSGVKNIDMNVFWGDYKIKNITVLAKEPPTVKWFLYNFESNVYTDAILYIPTGCIEKYKNATIWKEFKNIQEIGGGSIKVTKITLNMSSATLNVGDTKQLTATITPSNATSKTVTWSSTNTSVAIVSSTGLVTAKAAGKATIICKANDGSGMSATCSVTVLSNDIDINATNFPDSDFRDWILKQDWGKDGKLTDEENSILDLIWVRGFSHNAGNIKSLKGVELFRELTTLDCCYNQITFLDISNNTHLLSLDCNSNQLTSLDVSKNTYLRTLKCNSNQLTSLDVSKSTALTELNCSDNRLTSLDVSKNTALTDLRCHLNDLTSLDVSKNTKLTRLICRGNRLTSLDVSNTELTELWCDDNLIKGVEMDRLIASLPMNKEGIAFHVIDSSSNSEGNVCTKAQVTAAKARGWIPMYWNGLESIEYEGSDNTPVTSPISKIILSVSSTTLNVGDTKQLAATITPSNATNKAVTWSSSNTSVATISSTGLVTAKAAGTATITCKANDGSGKSATCTVTVTAPVEDPSISFVSVTSSNTNLLNLTQNDKLKFSATFKNTGRTANIRTMLAILDKETITFKYRGVEDSREFVSGQQITIDYEMSLKDVAEGNYVATVVYNKDWSSGRWSYMNDESLKDITVKATSIPITKIALSASSSSLNVGDTKQLAYTVTPSNATNTTVTWSSSNASVATVSNSGLVTAKAAGSATITCKANDGSGVSAICKVTVTAPSILKGDVDGDDIVTPWDLVALADVILERIPETPAAEIDGESGIDSGDYVELVKILLGQKHNSRLLPAVSENAEVPVTLNVQPFITSTHKIQELAVCLNNLDARLTAVQFDLVLPEGLSLRTNEFSGEFMCDMGQRTSWDSHQLAANGTIDKARFLLVSNSNEVIDGTEGTIVKIPIVTDERFVEGTVTLKGIVGVMPNGNKIKIPEHHYQLSIVDTNGISHVNESNNNDNIYSLSGQRQTGLKRGVYIIGNKKIIINK